MDIDQLEDMYKEFKGKWCRLYFDRGKAILKIVDVLDGQMLCQNVRGSKKLINIYEVRNLEEFSGLIFSTGELVKNGVVVSTQQAIQNATNK